MSFSVAVFCGSSNGSHPAYLRAAEDLGRLLGERKIDVIYGGGLSGLMGKVAASARAAQGNVFGFMASTLLEKEGEFQALTTRYLFSKLSERKEAMINRAQGFIILPGGFGTLDEIFEILVLKKLNVSQKPIVFVNTCLYWNPFLDCLRHLAKEAFIMLEDLTLFKVVDTPQDALDFLTKS